MWYSILYYDIFIQCLYVYAITLNTYESYEEVSERYGFCFLQRACWVNDQHASNWWRGISFLHKQLRWQSSLVALVQHSIVALKQVQNLQTCFTILLRSSVCHLPDYWFVRREPYHFAVLDLSVDWGTWIYGQTIHRNDTHPFPLKGFSSAAQSCAPLAFPQQLRGTQTGHGERLWVPMAILTVPCLGGYLCHSSLTWSSSGLQCESFCGLPCGHPTLRENLGIGALQLQVPCRQLQYSCVSVVVGFWMFVIMFVVIMLIIPNYSVRFASSTHH